MRCLDALSTILSSESPPKPDDPRNATMLQLYRNAKRAENRSVVFACDGARSYERFAFRVDVTRDAFSESMVPDLVYRSTDSHASSA